MIHNLQVSLHNIGSVVPIQRFINPSLTNLDLEFYDHEGKLVLTVIAYSTKFSTPPDLAPLSIPKGKTKPLDNHLQPPYTTPSPSPADCVIFSNPLPPILPNSEIL